MNKKIKQGKGFSLMELEKFLLQGVKAGAISWPACATQKPFCDSSRASNQSVLK